jgi:hypothetical protein
VFKVLITAANCEGLSQIVVECGSYEEAVTVVETVAKHKESYLYGKIEREAFILNA